jgi:hypothetical protein
LKENKPDEISRQMSMNPELKVSQFIKRYETNQTNKTMFDDFRNELFIKLKQEREKKNQMDQSSRI